MKETTKIKEFIGGTTVIDINQEIKDNVVRLSKTQKLKLPDCIILATAIYLDIPLLSSDKELTKTSDVSVLYYEQ